MLSALRSRITYVNVVATLVLVFAMTGGAYAAKKYLITSTKQISPSVLKQLQGKSGGAGPGGVAGAAGAQGPQGPAGPAGSSGAKGETGSAGKEGSKGTTGNEGPKGVKGVAGEPWPAGGTLPSKATETGVWALGTVTGGAAPGFSGPLRLPISFNIPLAVALSGAGCNTVEPGPPQHVATTCHVHFINAAGKELVNNVATVTLEELASTVCQGTVAKPTAPAGNLCVYVGLIEHAVGFSGDVINAEEDEAPGTSTAGAVISFFPVTEGAQASGVWAVTGED